MDVPQSAVSKAKDAYDKVCRWTKKMKDTEFGQMLILHNKATGMVGDGNLSEKQLEEYIVIIAKAEGGNDWQTKKDELKNEYDKLFV